jgi:AraC family transcriptional regulator
MDTKRPPPGSVDNARARALSTDCRVISRLLPAEELLFAGDSTCLGTFACRPQDPLFRAESPSTAHCMVFSRTPVWIRHEHGVRYVADPTVATFHNRGRVYQRWQIVDEGDRCDWVAYADDVLVDAVSRFDRGGAGRNPVWFPAEFVPVSSHVYARQRQLFDRLHAGACDGSAVEEEAVLLLDDVLDTIAPALMRPLPRRHDFDAVQHVRAVIASAPAAAVTLRALAQHAGMSPFQLCRTFSRVFGETMTSYRMRLRLLSALEQLRAGVPLIDVALAHGFSSHSHFTAAFGAAFGTTPTAWRRGRQ